MLTPAATSISHIYWIGGSPCSGKSSIADDIAEKHDMVIYRCDDAYYEHIKNINSREHPVFYRLAQADCDGIWMRPVGQQIEEELALYREEFPMILADILALPDDRPVIAEGAALLPDLIQRLSVDRSRMIWIVPTEAFQREHYARRDWRHDIVRDCSDPDQAWENWMRRDAGFANAVKQQTEKRAFPLITVDGKRSLAETLSDVERHFRLTCSLERQQSRR